jgi:hypothetical protein
MGSSIITLPNGVEIEAPLEETGEPCLICGEPAVAMDFPGYQHMDPATVDSFCPKHLFKVVEDIKGIVDGKP